MGWHACRDPAGGVGALCNFPSERATRARQRLLDPSEYEYDQATARLCVHVSTCARV